MSLPTRSPAELPSVTAATMRDVDRLAVEAFGISLLQMMELAGCISPRSPASSSAAPSPGGRSSSRRDRATTAGAGSLPPATARTGGHRSRWS